VSESGDASFLNNDAQRLDLQAQIDALRGILDQVRKTLRDAHDQPASQLREQAASLSETFVQASSQALAGFERAESRLVDLEQNLQKRMTQLSRDIEAMIVDVRSARPPALPAQPAAFSLESVMRIHDEVRDADAGPVSGSEALREGLDAFANPSGAANPARLLPAESATALTARMESLERAVGRVSAPARLSYATIALLVAVATIAAFTVWMQRRVSATLTDAAQRVSAAEQQTGATTELVNSRLAATREEAARQVADAQQSAAQARIVGTVLAAPDLVRYWLVGSSANPRAYAQMLFSRSRGMVFSASRLPAPGAGKTYQVWLLTKGGPVSAGLAMPDSAGRVTLSTDVPLTVPKRITGTSVTVEPTGGRPQPSGAAILVHAR